MRVAFADGLYRRFKLSGTQTTERAEDNFDGIGDQVANSLTKFWG